eukprot:TRINITY_DN8262_c0_g1_i2.p1 TRINITY_DN8262_c0_g1~~TRINITY_DN8262_c0_g1_i2.p1  ORF type:complete len:210 (+),score=43.41 TRINITY_DN8262_c0_g1_i2:60-632(+)
MCIRDRSIAQILSAQGLLSQAEGLSRLLSSYSGQSKDVVFLLDYSSSMGKGGRIEHAIRNLLGVFDQYVKDEDYISLITFDLNCRVRFGLTQKRGNKIQLRKQIEACVEPGGATAMYDAITMALQLHNDAKKRSGEVVSRWIVALTDGEDTASEAQISDVEEALAANDVSFIAIGSVSYTHLTLPTIYSV